MKCQRSWVLPGTIKTLRQQMETAKEQIDIPFEKEQELQTKSARLAELNILLNMDKHENEVLDGRPDEDMDVPEKKAWAMKDEVKKHALCNTGAD